MSCLVCIKPLQYVHVLNQNTNVKALKVGPQSLTVLSNEKVDGDPFPFVVIPPGCYCVVGDPVRKNEAIAPYKLCLGETEVRFHGEPFPLYPGEYLVDAPAFGQTTRDCKQAIKKLPIVKENQAIRLKALQDFDDGGVARIAGDMWQFRGPFTYHPRPEVSIEGVTEPTIIHQGHVLKLQATQDTVDNKGNKRVTGEEWLIDEPGAYLPDVYEMALGLTSSYTLAHYGLHLKAKQTVTDSEGKLRMTGEEWLFTDETSSEYNIQVGVEVMKVMKKTVVKKGQYAVVINPVDEKGKTQLSKQELRVGLCSFFLHPGESLKDGKIHNAHVLSEDESFIVQALEEFEDSFQGEDIRRKPGDKWLIKGPLSYIPPVSVKLGEKRQKIALSKNEGIYVQDSKTGKVRPIMGPCSYMLTADEDLWKKELSPEIEDLLCRGGGKGSEDIRKIAYFEQSIDPNIAKGRDKTRVVTYRCPSNTAVQVYNYPLKTARVIFGPDLVVLGPQENFNVLSLSAGKPKKEDALKSLCLMLGPDFISDIIEVETSDHARLRIQFSSNNYFEVDKTSEEMAAEMFSVPDFIGFACRQLASRIRATVALTTFDQFHRYSSCIIQAAVFGEESLTTKKTFLKFDVNHLVISGIDIQSIEPVDKKMRDSLTKSVQLAIEISTSSIEAAAAHEAKRTEQEARGQLERQKLVTEKESEKERAKLYALRATAAAVESTGQATAEAQAQAERALIEAHSVIELTRLKAEADYIESSSKLETENMLRYSELDFKRKKDEIEINKQKALVATEVSKFAKMVQSIGKKTLVAMANAGPENQVNLLKSLGLESVLLTDGNSPINLFQTAAGLVSSPGQQNGSLNLS